MRLCSNPESIDKDRWQSLVESHPYGNVFQTPQMYAVFRDSKNSAPLLLIEGESNTLKGVYLGEILKENWDLLGVSRRVVFYGDPVVKELNEHSFASIFNLKIMLSLFTELRYITPDIFPGHLFSRYRIPHLNALIPLLSEEENLKIMKKDKRKGIRQAQKTYNLEIIEDNSPAGIACFYKMLKTLYQNRHHPVRGVDFFQNIGKHLAPVGMAKYLFATFNGEPIATQLSLYFKKTIFTFYTATVPDHSGKHAGDLIIWHLIREGIRKGYKQLDFGGGGDPGKSYRPRDYKARFGTTFTDIGRIRIPTSKGYYIAKGVYEWIQQKS